MPANSRWDLIQRLKGQWRNLSERGHLEDVGVDGRRVAWLGRVMRMDDKRTPKRILQWKPVGTRTRGRPRKRWIAGTEEDLQIMGVRRWRKQCEKRTQWRKITEKAKTHSGL